MADVVTPVAAMGETGMEVWLSSDDSVGLRYGDGVADATEGVVAAIAAAGGDDEVVFAAGINVTGTVPAGPFSGRATLPRKV